MQLIFIISDGRFGDKRQALRQWIRRAIDANIFVVFLIVDSDNKETILDIQQVSYPNGKLTISNYIDEFPFPYYIILRKLANLPEVLADALRQWFELVLAQRR